MFQGAEGDELVEYRAVSVLSIIGLLLGLLSFLAMIRLFLLIVPAAAVFVCLLAFSRIRESENRLVGRKAATLGLALAVLFAAAAPAHAMTRRYLIAEQAKPLAEQFLSTLADREPQKAIELTKFPSARQPKGAHLWEAIRSDDEARQAMVKFADHPLIKTLLALGNRATVRFYRCVGLQDSSMGTEQITLIYAVTHEVTGQKRTFFVSLALTRTTAGKAGVPRWRISLFQGGVSPNKTS